MKFAYHTHVGKIRQVNQDRACVLKNDDGETFGIICDGMGGHVAGELAASLAIETLCQSFVEASPLKAEKNAIEWLNHAISLANSTIYEDAKTNWAHKGMGTTIVCCLVLKDIIIIAHVGDSRAYILYENQLHQLTKDHTYVNVLIESGSITKEEAKIHPQRNILMKALGVFEEVVVSTMVLENRGQFILLCSDGLYNCLNESEMEYILNQDMSLEEKTFQLIQSSNDNGGYDNISVVLMDGGELSE